jgi:DNA-binding HxlR family transcriptional regulator
MVSLIEMRERSTILKKNEVLEKAFDKIKEDITDGGITVKSVIKQEFLAELKPLASKWLSYKLRALKKKEGIKL